MSLASVLESLGEVLLHQGELAQAQATIERALSIQDDKLDPGSLDLALTLHTLAETRRAQGEYGKAEQYYRRALSIRELHAANPKDLAATLEGLASVLQATGREAEAEAAEARAREILELAGGHVAVLVNRLRLFSVERLVAGKLVVAWSAGAIALADTVVLFHDDPPHGEGYPEGLRTQQATDPVHYFRHPSAVHSRQPN